MIVHRHHAKYFAAVGFVASVLAYELLPLGPLSTILLTAAAAVSIVGVALTVRHARRLL